MKLNRLVIDNFRALKHAELGFADGLGNIRPMTVLAGPNGCGKTSVIFAIVQTLRGVMGYNTADVPEPSDLDIYRTGAMGLSRAPRSATVEMSLRFDESELTAIARIFEETVDDAEKSSSLPQPDEETALRGRPSPRETAAQLRSLAGSGGQVDVTWVYPPGSFQDGTRRPPNYLRNCNPRSALYAFRGRGLAIRGWRSHRLADPKLLDQIGGIYLFPQDRNLRTRVTGNGAEERRFGQLDGEYDPEERKRSEPIPIWGILQYLSSYTRARREVLPDEENWEKRIQTQFNRICSPKEYQGFMYEADDPNGAPYLKDGDTYYPLQMAASGEQVIIEYITRLTYPSPLNHSLILIDEPEVHLHPSWVRQLYRALPQIGEDNQYIVTTHSLELRRLAAEDGNLLDMGELEDAQ